MVVGRQVDQPNVILVEGPSDAAFITALLKCHDMFSQVNVCSISGVTRGSHRGRDSFGAALRALRVSARGPLSRVVIVTDADDDAQSAFDHVRSQVKALRDSVAPKNELQFAVPDAPGRIQRGAIALGILTIPLNSPSGCFEDVLYPVAASVSPLEAQAVDGLVASSPVHRWKPRSQIKAKLRCLLATTHEPQPDIAPVNLWTDNRGGGDRIPINDRAFEPLATLFRSLLSDPL